MTAQGIEAGTGETEGLDPQGESSVRQDAPYIQGPPLRDDGPLETMAMSPLTAEKVAARERERHAIIEYLCNAAMADPVAGWPDWRLWLYAIFRPVKMVAAGARMAALADAAQAISKEEHMPRIVHAPIDTKEGE
ncbi:MULTISPECIES: hypothetical protein [Alphaproteobacteria]|uniref:hypothetical protein n=1 Tax=Sphingopyxis sp. TaxID=1908224 RepID=UPI0040340DDB